MAEHEPPQKDPIMVDTLVIGPDRMRRVDSTKKIYVGDGVAYYEGPPGYDLGSTTVPAQYQDTYTADRLGWMNDLREGKSVQPSYEGLEN